MVSDLANVWWEYVVQDGDGAMYAGPIEIKGAAWAASTSGSESVRDITDGERWGEVWREPINMGAADCALDPDSVSDIADGD